MAVLPTNIRLRLPEATRNSVSESIFGYGVDNAKGTGVLIYTNPTIEGLQSLPTFLQGGVRLDANALKHWGILRYMPQRHSYNNSLIIKNITNVTGTGKRAVVGSPTVDRNFGTVKAPVIWTNYEIGVEYAPRKFNYKPDSEIKLYNSTYYNFNGTGVNYRWCTESARFVTVREIPGGDVMTSKQGQMYAATSDDSAPGSATATAASSFQGNPFQRLPNSTVTMTWWQVPYSYIMSRKSYIRNCPLGVINQYDFFAPDGGTEFTYPAGSLLYNGYELVEPNEGYLPPIPQDLIDQQGQRYGSSQMLCNIQFNFLRTRREAFAHKLPTLAQVGADVNKNWLVKGWNLQPWLQTPNKYYYWHVIDNAAPNDKSKWYPCHNSFPFELFFINPDYSQPAGFAANALEVIP